MYRRTLVVDAVQAIIVGGSLAYFTANRILGFLTFLPGRTNSSGIVQAFFLGAALVHIVRLKLIKEIV